MLMNCARRQFRNMPVSSAFSVSFMKSMPSFLSLFACGWYVRHGPRLVIVCVSYCRVCVSYCSCVYFYLSWHDDGAEVVIIGAKLVDGSLLHGLAHVGDVNVDVLHPDVHVLEHVLDGHEVHHLAGPHVGFDDHEDVVAQGVAGLFRSGVSGCLGLVCLGLVLLFFVVLVRVLVLFFVFLVLFVFVVFRKL